MNKDEQNIKLMFTVLPITAKREIIGYLSALTDKEKTEKEKNYAK